jgi:protoporphyrinogen oxidase
MGQQRVIIIGAGPAGLTAAYQSLKHSLQPIVLETGDKVGGIARTEQHNGYRFDIGGHRFYTKIDQVQDLWREMLGQDFRKVPRLSRIYYRDRFFSYPLEIFNALFNLGIIPSCLILVSYFRWKIRPYRQEETFEQWVTNRFGRRLYRTFFKTYTEKVWGIPCHEIRADWAAQRIQNLSLKTAIQNAVFGVSKAKSLINEFDYPVLGPGQMWERFASAVARGGGQVRLNTEVLQIKRDGMRVRSVISRKAGKPMEVEGSHFISSMALVDLINRLDPPPPPEVLAAAAKLNYRSFLIVGLVLDRPNLFPDNWVYVHSAEVKVARIQNFGNWSAAMVPHPEKTSIGMEYFCNEGDALWSTPDDQLIRLATQEFGTLRLASGATVEDGIVIRQPRAYPVYDSAYLAQLNVLQNYLRGFENLQTIGRNGMHRYNNQDHSMLTGLLAVKNLAGERHDLWNVNTERSYYEEFSMGRAEASPGRPGAEAVSVGPSNSIPAAVSQPTGA